MLKTHHNPDEELVIAWWDMDYFPECKTENEWQIFCEHTEDKFSWSGAHDLLQLELDYLLAGDRFDGLA